MRGSFFAIPGFAATTKPPSYFACFVRAFEIGVAFGRKTRQIISMKLLAVIPAYNAGLYLGKVIDDVKRHVRDILVIDDGSTDDTGATAITRGVNLIRNETNKGKGAALKRGFEYAIAGGHEWVITIDSDGQHDPAYIPAFISTLAATRADMIIGSRKGNLADMPFDRRCSNYLTSRILSWLLGARIEDSQSGFRLMSVAMLASLNLTSEGYQLESELIIKAVRAGFKIAFVPVKVVYGRNFPSSIRNIEDTYRWVRMVLEEM